MEKVSTEKIRNIVLAGHGGSGKTSLVEALLFFSGVVNRLGKVEEGNTVSDFEPEETKRQISISLALAPLFYQGYKINLIDTPGYADFTGEVVSGLAAADSLLIVVDALSGAQVQTEKVFRLAEGKPTAFFINKIDKEHASFEEALQSIQALLEIKPVVLQFPVGEGQSFKGIVDLVSQKFYLTGEKNQSEEQIPADQEEKATRLRESLVEAAAEGEDELLEKYLSEGELTEEEIIRGLKKAFVAGSLFPVYCGSSVKLCGLKPLLNLATLLFPSPLDISVKGKRDGEEIIINPEESSLAALVFKTVTDPYVGRLSYVRVFSGSIKKESQIYNATRQKKERIGHLYLLRGKHQEEIEEVIAGDIASIPKLSETFTGDTLAEEKKPVLLPPLKFPEPVFSVAIEPKTQGDEEKLSTCLQKLAEEDLTLRVTRNTETKQTVVSGLGDLHLEILTERLNRKFKVEAKLLEPRIPYKETIKASAKAQGKYKRQSGGRGQYGDVWLEVEPLPRGGGFEFVDKIVGGVVPKNYIPAVEKGVKEAMENGILAGYPVVDVKVTLYDGSYHPVDSSDMAFKIAGSMGFRKAASEASPVLLEPIMNLEVTVPEKYMGDVMGDISSKRGKVLGMESKGKYQTVKAQVPLAEMSKYATELRSLTHGEGSFTAEFSHYEEVPFEIAKKIIEQAAKEKESD
jgi:elongation factor G